MCYDQAEKNQFRYINASTHWLDVRIVLTGHYLVRH